MFVLESSSSLSTINRRTEKIKMLSGGREMKSHHKVKGGPILQYCCCTYSSRVFKHARKRTRGTINGSYSRQAGRETLETKPGQIASFH